MTTAATRLWHPFADMAQVAGQEVVFERGEGAWLWDDEGRRYLDGTAGLWFCGVGHGRGALAEAAARQMRTLAAWHCFDRFASPATLALAERASALAPMPEAVAFFTSGGSEAVDTAAKLARRYWVAVGRPERRLLIVRESAYHGMAGYGTSLAGIEANLAGVGELVPGVVRVPPHDAPALERLLEERGGEVAAFFGEPVIGAGGVLPPAQGYWEAVQRACRKHDVLLVADEVITGFGRLGRWFGSQRYGIEPDMVVTAKGITSGYMPLGAVFVGRRVQEPFWRGNAGVFRHGYTYSGHATACAVALANLDILEGERLLERVAALETAWAAAFAGLRRHPLVGDVRSVGLLAGVELQAEALTSHPGLADKVAAEARNQGLLSGVLVGRALQLSPAYVIDEAQIGAIPELLRGALDAVARTLPVPARA